MALTFGFSSPVPITIRRQPEEKRECRRNRQREVARRDDDAAPEDRAAQPEKAIRDPTARQRDHVHGGRIQAIDRRRGHIVQSHAAGCDGVGHVQDEDRPHPVVAEPLPHLGEEERGQTARMPEPASLQSSIDQW